MTGPIPLENSQNKEFQQDLASWGPKSSRDPLDLVSAQAYCRKLAQSHYENFSIASFLIPKEYRQAFFNVYAYCRWSDDLADEIGSKVKSLELLQWWQDELKACFEGTPRHPVMTALAQTVREFTLTRDPFEHLLDAFRQDQSVERYQSDEEVLDYCRRSANPVGRILLQIAGVSDPRCHLWSDLLCTGLQIANFCQDMGRDACLGRIYLPRDRWGQHHLDEEELLSQRLTEKKREALREWTKLPRLLLTEALPLVKHVPQWLSRDISLFAGGGLAILDAIQKAHFDVWSRRIEVSATTKGYLLFKAWSRPKSISHEISRHRNRTSSSLMQPWDASHRHCLMIARSSGSSFYRSFRLLRTEKQRGMYAFYAFARTVDDIADENDPQEVAARSRLPPDFLEKIVQSKRMVLGAWHEAVDSIYCQPSMETQQVLSLCDRYAILGIHRQLIPALSFAIQQFQIPKELLHGIVSGAEMDLQESRRFESYEELREYCFQVASTVGLGCLHIWRGDVAKAREAAIECGMAFQWTNILRDLSEDALRGRIYLPRDELERFNVEPSKWLEGHPNGDWKRLVELQIARAKKSYEAGWKVRDHIESDGQRMFSLMWNSYFQLLLQIEKRIESLWVQRITLPWGLKIPLVASHFLTPSYIPFHLETQKPKS